MDLDHREADLRTGKRLDDVARYVWVLSGAGLRHGDRTLPTQGGSTTWFDARPYQEGDDLRYVDWRGYARSRRLHTRLHMAERGVARSLFLDASRSMHVAGKRAWSDALVEVLVRARGGDGPCAVHLFGDARPGGTPRSLVDSWIEAWRSSPAYGGRHAVVVVGDLLTEESWAPAWRAVTARGAALIVVHVLARSEIDPTFADATLRDVETSSTFDVTRDEVEAYRRVVRTFVARRRREAIQAGARYARSIVPGTPAAGASLVHAFADLVGGRVVART